MNLLVRKCVHLTLLLLAGCLAWSTAQAQTAPQTATGVRGGAEDPGIALSRHIATLSQTPNSLDALLGAGNAAVALGDPEAALTFLGKAEEIAPRDGRVKAAIGSALVMMEQGRTALRFFEEARVLGAPEADYAGYRGLAYDLTGDSTRAQHDYRIALARREDPEVRRRFALSLAIAGNRDAALAAIDGQLRRQDRAAWRVRAFILALTGDAAGATHAVEAVMPAQAGAMAPFLARLPSLSPADRALAVNFGHFPGTGQATRLAATAATARPPVAPSQPTATVPRALTPTNAGRPDPGQSALGASPVRTSNGIGPSPGTATVAPPRAPLGPPAVVTSPTSLPNSVTSPVPASVPRASLAGPPAPAALAVAPSPLPVSASPAPLAGPPAPASALTPLATASSPLPAPLSPSPSALASAVSIQAAPLPASTIAPSVSEPALASATSQPTIAQPQAGLSTTTTKPDTFADVATLVASLSSASDDTVAITPPPARPAKSGVAPPAAQSHRTTVAAIPPTPAPGSAAKPTAKSVPATKAGATKPEKPAKPPVRTWVQIGHSSSPSVLPSQYETIKARAPKLFAARSAWTATQKGTNRLLVGPFKSDKEAEAFVSQLAKAKVESFSWASPAGLEIKKLK